MTCNNWLGTGSAGSKPLAPPKPKESTHHMSQLPAIQVSDLSGRPALDLIIRSDLKTPGRIYCEFPAYASLSHEEAIALANRLIDVMESTT